MSTLRRATPHEAETQYLSQAKHTPWGGPLDPASYLARKRLLERCALPTSVWVLVDDTAGAGDGEHILASCELTTKPAVVSYPNPNSQVDLSGEGKEDGKEVMVRETSCIGISCVYLAPEMRGRGYGDRLMREVGGMLASAQQDVGKKGGGVGCGFGSVLFSDIGATFYTRYGFLPRKLPYLSIEVSPNPNPDSTTTTTPTPTLIPRSSLPQLCTLDKKRVISTLEKYTQHTGHAAISLLTDPSTLDRWFVREDFTAEYMGISQPQPQPQDERVCGVLVNNPDSPLPNTNTDHTPRVLNVDINMNMNKADWCLWTRMWYSPTVGQREGNRLYVLRVSLAGRDTTPADGEKGLGEGRGQVERVKVLLGEAVKEARKWEMESVEVWDPCEVVVRAARELDCADPGREVERVTVGVKGEVEVPHLRWMGGHGDGQDEGQVDWIGVEKGGWC
ncbi:hypothetical protein BO78DRAFT_428915 [Aspergillus sclerotiicarbonarius CBS 121057]|uniref:LYC1 C-terminal domain-containing protein n=1 Tax=Aspergillus sclerotiicarbonarius (strain CBS 121057 / IBT 28362) TaxID=1448318 RepID=A0A319FJ23_ASPSB|nr:hypothetical protein BO78DRAFT_428915 [Aspergillus sclerotiicarbonarius CBS 121057]